MADIIRELEKYDSIEAKKHVLRAVVAAKASTENTSRVLRVSEKKLLESIDRLDLWGDIERLIHANRLDSPDRLTPPAPEPQRKSNPKKPAKCRK